MVLWKIWFDLRVRFYVCLGIAILSVLLLIISFPLFGTLMTWVKTEIPPAEWKLIEKYASDYSFFMDQGWFREVQFMAAFAVVFTLGGIMTEGKSRTVHLSLSLPVERRRWILYQAGLAFALVTILCCLAAVLIVLGGLVYGKPYSISRALLGTSLLTFMTLPWIGATLAITSFLFDKLKTALLIFGVSFLAGIFESFPPVRVWLPQNLVGLMETNTFPWQSLVVILIIGIGGIFVSIKRFEEADF